MSIAFNKSLLVSKLLLLTAVAAIGCHTVTQAQSKSRKANSPARVNKSKPSAAAKSQASNSRVFPDFAREYKVAFPGKIKTYKLAFSDYSSDAAEFVAGQTTLRAQVLNYSRFAVEKGARKTPAEIEEMLLRYAAELKIEQPRVVFDKIAERRDFALLSGATKSKRQMLETRIVLYEGKFAQMMLTAIAPANLIESGTVARFFESAERLTKPDAYLPYSYLKAEIAQQRLTIDNTEIGLPCSAAVLERLLGKADRVWQGIKTVRVWEARGITAHAESETDQIISVRFFIKTDEQVFGFTPWRAFNGELKLDGVSVTPDLTTDEINRRKTGAKFELDDEGDPIFWAIKSSRYWTVLTRRENGRNSATGTVHEISLEVVD